MGRDRGRKELEIEQGGFKRSEDSPSLYYSTLSENQKRTLHYKDGNNSQLNALKDTFKNIRVLMSNKLNSSHIDLLKDQRILLNTDAILEDNESEMKSLEKYEINVVENGGIKKGFYLDGTDISTITTTETNATSSSNVNSPILAIDIDSNDNDRENELNTTHYNNNEKSHDEIHKTVTPSSSTDSDSSPNSFPFPFPNINISKYNKYMDVKYNDNSKNSINSNNQNKNENVDTLEVNTKHDSASKELLVSPGYPSPLPLDVLNYKHVNHFVSVIDIVCLYLTTCCVFTSFF